MIDAPLTEMTMHDPGRVPVCHDDAAHGAREQAVPKSRSALLLRSSGTRPKSQNHASLFGAMTRSLRTAPILRSILSIAGSARQMLAAQPGHASAGLLPAVPPGRRPGRPHARRQRSADGRRGKGIARRHCRRGSSSRSSALEFAIDPKSLSRRELEEPDCPDEPVIGRRL